MKKKALATKMAAFVMAGAMTMAMGFPALADTAPTELLEATFIKNVKVPDNTYAPSTSFSFTIAPATPETGAKDYCFEGVPGGLYFVGGLGTNQETISVDFKSQALAGTIQETYTDNTKKIEVAEGLFTKPGVYFYTITEAENTYKGIKIDAPKNVYVHVMLDEAGVKHCFITSSVPDAEGNSNKQASIAFNNTYGLGEDGQPDGSIKTLEIDKVVAGSLRNENDDFKVEIKVVCNDSALESDAKKFYDLEIWNKSSDGDYVKDTAEYKLTSGEALSNLPIKGASKIYIYGLSEDDVFYIKETDKGDYNNENGYTANDVTAVELETTGYEYAGKVNTGKETTPVVTLTNTRNAITPTGIVTEYAPYILLVAAAGTFAVLFLRKKKEEF